MAPLDTTTSNRAAMERATAAAAAAIPPLWPLASSVAVNPFLGQAGESLAQAGARLARVAGIPITMPRAWYTSRIESGAINDADLAAALAEAPARLRPADVDELIAAARQPSPPIAALPTIADLAAQISGIDWPGVIAERLGAWAAGYFDEGQALWAAPRGRSAYSAWRAIATHDLTPEIIGLPGFARHVANAPRLNHDAIASIGVRLGLSDQAAETYFHQLLLSLGGFAQYARYLRWQAELIGGSDDTITALLAIRLVWEEALFLRYHEQINPLWANVRAQHAMPVRANRDQIVDVTLQEAAERAVQRGLAEMFALPPAHASGCRPLLQAAFCIDVRSEVYRRALEAIHPDIQTIGFAGFFGIFASHRRFASDVVELRLPVLLNPTVMTCSGGPDDATDAEASRLKARAKRAWGRFKLAAVSCFAFVEASGPLYAVKLVRDGLGLHGEPAPHDPAPRIDPPLDLVSQVKIAEMALRAMSMTKHFGRIVLLAGHGANVTNNPHASAMHCGACGGYSGEMNARVLAALLNDESVRASLAVNGIEIPSDTLFLGALHDTTTDAMTLYAADHPSALHRDDLIQVKTWLERAAKVTRGERALRLPRAAGEADIVRRSRDWSEVRPEWALAGCSAFIAAPRRRTSAKDLEGRAFLHDYNWQDDREFSILELIMTAPVVVASWISLQYYGSTVSPKVFGGGNKLLHNVTGGIGVIEGNGGLLRPGLPWQSVHDGQAYAHEPLRLSVCIEAPVEAMTDILSRHTGVRALFDNRWLHLLAIDDVGRLAWRYNGNLHWVPFDESYEPQPVLRATEGRRSMAYPEQSF